MRRILLATLPAWFFSLAGVAEAQTPPTPPSEDAVVNEDELIVTARRRDETLIEVPVAVSAITAADQRNFVIDDMADMLRQLPSTDLVNGGPAYSNQISIRGQGGGRNGFSESAVGLYRDGHYIAGGGFGGRGLSAMNFFDLQRIEVLRGPQGALYGRSAVGGAVNVIPNRPTDDFGFSASMSYNSVERTEAEAVLNLPITSEAALRVGGFLYDQDGGFVTQLSTGRTIDQERTSGARAVFEVAPTNDTNVRVTYEYSDSHAPGFAINGYRALRNNLTTLDPDPFVRDMNRVGYTDILDNSGFLDVEHDFGWANLQLRGGFTVRSAARSNDDLDHYLGFQGITSVFPVATPAQPIDLVSNQTEDYNRGTFTGVLSSPDHGRLSWLVGAEVLQDRSEGLTQATGFAGSSNGLRAQLRDETSVDQMRSWALFGALEYDLTTRLALGLEARMQTDDKEFAFDRRRNSSASTTVEITGIRLDESWTRVMPVATLRYSLSEHASIYGRIATGYRPGGYNGGIPTDIPGSGNLIPYDPEDATSYETGFKLGLFDGHLYLEGAAYYTETDHVQIVSAASTTNTSFILQNGVGSTVWGGEFVARGNVELGGGQLDVQLGLSTSDGEFEDGTTAIVDGVSTDLSGNRVNRTRDLIGTLNLMYRHELGGGLTGFGTTSYQTQIGGFENAQNTRTLPDFELIDARIGVEGGRWRLSIYGKNLTDQVYTMQTLANNAYLNDPLTYGAELSFRY